MTHQLISLMDCLLDAFANEHFCNPQEERQMWAIYEGLRRVEPGSFSWSAPNARKEHKCERGCSIKPGEIYFKAQIGYGYGSNLKLCAGCMAMVLYFMDVDKYPPRIETHWDAFDKTPVRIKSDAD